MLMQNSVVEDIKKLQNHKKLFNVKENPFLSVFEEFIKTKAHKYNHFLECSVKFEQNALFPNRFHIFFENKDKALVLRQLKDVMLFLKQLEKKGAKINYSLLKNILKIKTDLDSISEVFFGIDLRESIENSRAKLWLSFDVNSNSFFDYLIFQKLSSISNKKHIFLFCKDNFFIGIDFFFNNKTDLKLYLAFEDFQAKTTQLRLQYIFDKKIISLFSHTNELDFLYGKRNTIYFKTKNTSKFLDKLNKKQIVSLYSKIKEKQHMTNSAHFIIGLFDDEVISEKITTFKLYY